VAEDFEVPPAAEVIVEHRRFEDRADFLESALAIVGDIESANADFAFGGPDLAEHHADGGAFAGAVMTEEAEDFTLRHGEGEVADGGAVAEVFGDVVKIDHGLESAQA